MVRAMKRSEPAARGEKVEVERGGAVWYARPWPNGLGFDISCDRGREGQRFYEVWPAGSIVECMPDDSLSGSIGYRYVELGRPILPMTADVAVGRVLQALSRADDQWRLCYPGTETETET